MWLAGCWQDSVGAAICIALPGVLFSEGYERIATLLDLPEKSRPDFGQAVKVAAVIVWLENSILENGRGWLLIVDNINPDKLIATDDTNPDGPVKARQRKSHGPGDLQGLSPTRGSCLSRYHNIHNEKT